jgi:hypothetical protein
MNKLKQENRMERTKSGKESKAKAKTNKKDETGLRFLLEIINKIVPLIEREKYNHEVVEEICKSCLPYMPIKETTLFSYVLFSIFDELRIYTENTVWELGKMFGSAAQDREEERISSYLREDFISYLQTLKEKPQDAKELHRILSDMVYKWITFEREDLSKYR